MARIAYVSNTTTKTTATATKPVAAPTKARKAKTTAEAPAPEVTHAADVEAASWLARIQQSVDGFMKSVNVPSRTRLIVSGLLGLIACASTLYFSMQLVEMLVIAAMLYTGIGFISFVVTFIGVFVAFMTATTIGSKVFDMAMSFEYSNVKSRVAGFFGGFGKKAVAHA